MTTHWFWFSITMICVVWYSTVTIYVAIKGAADIKGMLARLSANYEREDQFAQFVTWILKRRRRNDG